MRLLCSRCYYDFDRHVPATNLDAMADYPGMTPACDHCTEAAGMEQAEQDFASFHGGSSWMDSAQIERAHMDGARR